MYDIVLSRSNKKINNLHNCMFQIYDMIYIIKLLILQYTEYNLLLANVKNTVEDIV